MDDMIVLEVLLGADILILKGSGRMKACLPSLSCADGKVTKLFHHLLPFHRV